MCLTHSAEIDKLAAALAKAQGAIGDAKKDSLNPHFKNKYADLSSVRDAIMAPLAVNGLSYVQFPEADGSKVSCETMLMHESGQWMRGKLTMVATQANPQGIGSAITYARRYSLMAVIGIAPAEDDDGNAASARPPQDNVRQAPRQFDDNSFEESTRVFEPAVSTAAIKMGRELKACKTIADLKAFRKTAEFRRFSDGASEADMAHVNGVGEARWEELETTDSVLLAG